MSLIPLRRHHGSSNVSLAQVMGKTQAQQEARNDEKNNLKFPFYSFGYRAALALITALRALFLQMPG